MKIGTIAYCAICGKEFRAVSYRQKCCSEQCQRKRVSQRQMGSRLWEKEIAAEYGIEPTPRQPEPEKSLAEVAKAAKEAGMTYGQYVLEMARLGSGAG